jgi:hypothetical protein
MLQTIQARDISLYELEEKFGLELVTKTDFFTEWAEKANQDLCTVPTLRTSVSIGYSVHPPSSKILAL